MLKQVLIGLLTFTLLFSITGCGGEEEQNTNQESNQIQMNELSEESDGTVEFVGNISMPTQDDLDEYVASQGGDPDLANCDTVSNLDLKNRCIQDNLIGLATKELDKSYCDQLEDAELQEICVNAVDKRLN